MIERFKRAKSLACLERFAANSVRRRGQSKRGRVIVHLTERDYGRCEAVCCVR